MFELGLAHQYDLEQFLCKRFQVGEHSDLFQHLIGEVLRFIHDKYRGLARAVAIQQPVVEPQQDLALGLRIAGNAKIGHHVVEKLWRVQARVKNKSGGYLLQAQPLEQLIDQRGLARAYFPSQQHETFSALDAISQARQCLLCVSREEEITRVRINIERIRPQAE